MFLKFPNDFLWGGAVSAEQTEGKGTTQKALTVFDLQEKQSPIDFYNLVGPQVTDDFMRHYREDILMWKDFKINSHRTSFSWARLFPEGDYNKPNMEAVNWYHDFIDFMINNGITPMFTLYHFDMPFYAMDKGGWESREVWDEFLLYSKFVLNEFASKVKIWTVMNEPWVPVEASYLGNIHYPKLKNDQSGANAMYGIIMATAKVNDYFNDFVRKQHKAKLGTIFNSSIVYPRDSADAEDVKAAKFLELFQFFGLTDPLIKGELNIEWCNWLKKMNLWPQNYESNDEKFLSKVKVDFIGLNFYQPLRAKKPDNLSNSKFMQYFEYYKMANRRENVFRGWEIYPKALYDTFQVLYERYGSHYEFMLTEYGIGVQNEIRFKNNDGIIDDSYRVIFMKEHLFWLHKFMTDFNAKVIGAHVWSTMDCWSWTNAYKNRYGLIEVDISTQKRTPKKSAYFMKSIILENGFEFNGEKTEDYITF